MVTSPEFVVAPHHGFVGRFLGLGFFANEQNKWQSSPEKHTEALELNWLLHLGQQMFLLQSQ